MFCRLEVSASFYVLCTFVQGADLFSSHSAVYCRCPTPSFICLTRMRVKQSHSWRLMWGMNACHGNPSGVHRTSVKHLSELSSHCSANEYRNRLSVMMLASLSPEGGIKCYDNFWRGRSTRASLIWLSTWARISAWRSGIPWRIFKELYLSLPSAIVQADFEVWVIYSE